MTHVLASGCRLLRERGFVIITGIGQTTPALWRSRFLTLSRRFGQPIAQSSTGDLVREVRDRGTAIGEGATARYSDSRFGGSLHTDGAQIAMPVPELFSLFCARQAVSGGEFVMVDLHHVLEQSAPWPDALEVLAGPFLFHTRSAEPGEARVVEKSVLFSTSTGRAGITYFRSYIESGHGAQQPLTAPRRRAINLLDDVLDDPTSQIVGRLRPGETIVVDNHRVIHGRTEFHDRGPDDARQRYQVWLRSSTTEGPSQRDERPTGAVGTSRWVSS